MTGTSKILTISFGAVSCRLEGFGAAPDAMRALGAYFCDCATTHDAADGAPPVPDPDRLARLVGRDIARRVEIHAEEGRIVLRLDADAEAELHRESDRVDTEPGRAPPSVESGPSSSDDAAAEMARIFARTDSHMADFEVRQRSTAHQHLRGALAATRADISDEPVHDPAAGDRPRYCDPDAARGDDPDPPLWLDPAHRVDRSPAAQGATGPASLDTGFRAFAEEVGATALHDRLEAAAAWLADVEGHVGFRRSVLLDKLSETDGTEPPLRDMLRICAQLLREGRLEARPGGYLGATSATRFRADASRRKAETQP